jgi:hypothetical protein
VSEVEDPLLSELALVFKKHFFSLLMTAAKLTSVFTKPYFSG